MQGLCQDLPSITAPRSRSAAQRRLARSVRARLAVSALAAVVLTQVVSCRGARSKHPNVILISIDCLNERQFEEALAGGYVPRLARLAGESVLFTRAYAHASWTTPSHMSMLTGLYPREHGRDVPWGIMEATNDFYAREPEHPTLASSLSAAGYETVAFVGVGSISAVYGLGRGFDTYHESRRRPDGLDMLDGVLAFRTWLQARKARPFLLFLHTYDFHYPRGASIASEREALRYVDQQLGTIFDDLGQRGLLESALIFVTGDHGSEMLAVNRRCSVHGCGHYDENLRVPLLVRLPGEKAARRDDTLVRHIDIFPTVADIVGLAGLRYQGRGVSLRDVLARRARPEFSFSEADGRCVERYGLVTQSYNYIYTPRGARQNLLQGDERFVDSACSAPCRRRLPVEELYDLRADPTESHNLLRGEPSAEATAALPGLRASLEASLNLRPRYRTRLVLGKRSPTMSPEIEAGLKALGYMQ